MMTGSTSELNEQLARVCAERDALRADLSNAYKMVWVILGDTEYIFSDHVLASIPHDVSITRIPLVDDGGFLLRRGKLGDS